MNRYLKLFFVYCALSLSISCSIYFYFFGHLAALEILKYSLFKFLRWFFSGMFPFFYAVNDDSLNKLMVVHASFFCSCLWRSCIISGFLFFCFFRSRNKQSFVIKKLFEKHSINIRVAKVIDSPQIRQFRLKIPHSVKVSQVTSLSDDLKLALALDHPPQIKAGNKGHITVDISKPPSTCFWSDYKLQRGYVMFRCGVGINGDPIHADLSNPNTCHVLVAGSTGSGKSEWLRSFCADLILNKAPDEIQLVIIDPKMLTFSAFKRSAFLKCPIIIDTEQATQELFNLCEEMDRRYQLLEQEGFDNLEERFQNGKKDFPFIIIIIDEFADLVLVPKKEREYFELLVKRIAGKGRASGIHLVLSTQSPYTNIITGIIRNNLPLKICLRVDNPQHSRTVLSAKGGETLLGRGDLLTNVSGYLERAQGLFVDKETLNEMVNSNVTSSVETPDEPQPSDIFSTDKIIEIVRNEIEKKSNDNQQNQQGKIDALKIMKDLTNKADDVTRYEYGDELRLVIPELFKVWQGLGNNDLSEKEFSSFFRDSPIFLRKGTRKIGENGKTKYCYSLSLPDMSKHGINIDYWKMRGKPTADNLDATSA